MMLRIVALMLALPVQVMPTLHAIGQAGRAAASPFLHLPPFSGRGV